MKIIISPAKKMNTDIDSLPWQSLPHFLTETENLLDHLRQMSPEALQKLWKCNDRIAALNIQRLESMDLHRNLTPAILSYEGIQYQYMAPGVFAEGELAYIQEHLRILSGFYGVLRPFDGVTPYRLEMQAKLPAAGRKDLYAFWHDKLARSIFSETDCVLNLASKEYSLCISRHLPEGARFITCVFGEEVGEKIVEKGTLCKMARGEMVRWLAEHQIKTPEAAKAFCRLNYRYDPLRSDDSTYVFVRREEAVCSLD